MAKKFPVKPKHPERICWGCDRYCSVDALKCGNGSLATMHPSELFGDDWETWVQEAQSSAQPAADPPPGAAGDSKPRG
ncbi:MAG TPA: DUF3079 domain-containing protein [Rubrivivax sp.]|nr:DUF3079 domain-containing protein [Burkholderiales bacterium]HNU10117.1 DUF3079 domain-containing protein [Rubrivivax sp.]